eukprot:689149-Pyramimonas_sp.AAC.1
MHKLSNMSNCGTLTRNLGLNRTPFSLNPPYLGWLQMISGLVVASFPEWRLPRSTAFTCATSR